MNAEFTALPRTDLPAMSKALCAVMELHARHTAFDGNLDFCPICVKSEGATYPCDTVQAIFNQMEDDDE